MRRLLLLFLLASLAPAHAQPTAPAALELGVFPYLSTRALLNTYEPLQRFLENRLGRPVLVVTAPDMRTFVERTLTGAYPLVVTAPHFARLAQVDAGYRPLLRPQRDLAAVFIVPHGGPVRSLADLRGKILATPDSLAIVTQQAINMLREQGLEPGRDVILRQMPSHNSSALAVREGAVDAAVLSNTAFLQLPLEQREGLALLARGRSLPHVMILARSDLGAAEAARFARLIQEFVEQTAEGRQFIDKLGYLGLRPPTEAELKSLDPYLPELRAALRAPR
ncbi:phosphate/phosphite/phosphonate ABC transporter substrate-binding protein [Thiobacter aerophilum]|uniref:Phosphate/phosphite/phosphonate ABC transporter substrate-binding protein n=1 Tax=Thiobacter aerophilum TaxID=3121275 RepID=A0ABV0EGS7_9BURK